MRKTLRRTASAVLALAVVAAALLTSGCSTPQIAMTVDGTEYTTGEYLAYLYNSFYQIYMNQSLYYYDLYGGDSYDVWNETYTYDDGTDNPPEYNLSDYIIHSAQDSIVRQVAVIRLMDEYGITLSEEDQAEIEEYLGSLKTDLYLDYGFNNESYGRMYREYNYNEKTLFYTLYGEGGQKEVPAEDIRNYFDENYLSYKMISYSLVDSEGNDLSDEEIAAVNEDLERYLQMYVDGSTFDAIIDQKAADDAAASGEDSEETTASTDADNRVDIDATQSGDAELVTALKEMAFGEVKIISYNTDSGTATKALVLRLDPEANRGNDEDGNAVDYFAQQHDTILYRLKSEEFDADISAKTDALDVEINERAAKKCDPYAFREMYAG